jgi:hypothetical protein
LHGVFEKRQRDGGLHGQGVEIGEIGHARKRDYAHAQRPARGMGRGSGAPNTFGRTPVFERDAVLFFQAQSIEERNYAHAGDAAPGRRETY